MPELLAILVVCYEGCDVSLPRPIHKVGPSCLFLCFEPLTFRGVNYGGPLFTAAIYITWGGVSLFSLLTPIFVLCYTPIFPRSLLSAFSQR
jgi:hypothetical protein